jgi:hypothetical protein
MGFRDLDNLIRADQSSHPHSKNPPSQDPSPEMFINRKIISKNSKNSNIPQPDIVIEIATVVI